MSWRGVVIKMKKSIIIIIVILLLIVAGIASYIYLKPYVLESKIPDNQLRDKSEDLTCPVDFAVKETSKGDYCCRDKDMDGKCDN